MKSPTRWAAGTSRLYLPFEFRPRTERGATLESALLSSSGAKSGRRRNSGRIRFDDECSYLVTDEGHGIDALLPEVTSNAVSQIGTVRAVLSVTGHIPAAAEAK